MQGTLIDFGEPANDNPFVTTPLQAPAPPVAAAAAEGEMIIGGGSGRYVPGL